MEKTPDYVEGNTRDPRDKAAPATSPHQVKSGARPDGKAARA